MRYLSVCSGIEAATVAWHPLGWTPVAFAEIEPFPSAVLAHHYPSVVNRGDMTRFAEWPDADVDLLVGGTPCQSFSVAGLRKGLDDPRGSLMLIYLALARRYWPRWLVWENVPGVLSADEGRAFGSLLGGLAELGYGFAYRVFDAQYFGLAQRRARVFVVGHLGDWRRAAAVLFERESLSGHPAPRREAGEGVTAGTLRSTDGGLDCDHAAAGHLITSAANYSNPKHGDPCHPLAAGAHPPSVAFAINSHAGAADGDQTNRSHANGGPVGFGISEDVAYSLRSGRTQSVGAAMQVRRLTPRECERLQGFPDDYTLIPYRGKLAADGPRYKALGNSMAVPVMRWIGARIALVEQVIKDAAA